MASKPIYITWLEGSPPPGGGGPVTISHLSNQDRRASTSGNWAMAAVTPTAGRRFLVLVGIQHDDSNSGDPSTMTLSDSQGLTWTKIGSVTDPLATYRHATVAFISSPAAATSTTITAVYADPNKIMAGVYEVGGSAGTIAGLVTNTGAATSGGYTVTLGATPTVDDVVIFARSFNYIGNGDGGLTMDTGWTVGTLFNGIVGGETVGLGVAHNDNLASTSVVVVAATTTSADTHDGVNIAFIIKAG